MNIDSFDATLYTSSTECLQALSQENIVLGRRLGARVFGLASRGIRFSYAFLDEVAQNGELSRCLADNAWNELNAAQAVAVESLLEKYSTSCRTVSNGATLLVYLADEAPTQLVAAPAQETTVSLVPKVLGIGGNLTVPGLLWDKKRLEESALTLLDSDDDQRLIEAFRYLFRAAMAAGQNPLGLIENVLRRGRTKVSLEAALMVRDNLNRELGRALQGLLSEDAQNIKDGLLYFTESASGPYAATCQAIVLPALIPLTQSTAFRTILLPSLPRLAKLLGSCVDLQDDASLRLMTAFLDALLSDLENMQLQERFAVSAFMFDFAPFYPPLKDYLLQQLRATLNADMQAFYGNILARLEPDEATRSEVNQCLVKLFAQHGGEVGMGRRLRATFRAIGSKRLRERS